MALSSTSRPLSANLLLCEAGRGEKGPEMTGGRLSLDHWNL